MDLPACGVVRDREAHAGVLARAGDERVRVEEGERLSVLALRVARELFAAHGERLEEAGDGYGCAPLSGATVRRDGMTMGRAGGRR